MRALTLTQPWAGLVASGIKRVENRPRSMIKREDFGKPFSIHASRQIDKSVYARIFEIAPELDEGGDEHGAPWHILSRVTSAIIGIATIDKVFDGGWTESDIARHADILSYSNGEKLGWQQARWFFGPVGYVLRDIRELVTPIPCRGALGFWRVPPPVELLVLDAARSAA